MVALRLFLYTNHHFIFMDPIATLIFTLLENKNLTRNTVETSSDASQRETDVVK